LLGVSPGSAPPPERVTEQAETPPASPTDREPTTRRVVEKAPERSVAVATSAVPPPSKAAQGAYRLQIALVRNRNEANALAARVRKEHGRAFGARKLEVDRTVLGNMGTFYRVRLGPFAAVDESNALCDQLRAKGYDCLVVMQ
jgi:cell division septation protein DedD